MKIIKEINIINKLGLHLRAAAQFVQTANRFQCDIWVLKDDARVNGKSIMGVMTLVAVQGTALKLEANGGDAQACLDALDKLAQGRFGEAD